MESAALVSSVFFCRQSAGGKAFPVTGIDFHFFLRKK
jgi:hypothetical protein